MSTKSRIMAPRTNSDASQTFSWCCFASLVMLLWFQATASNATIQCSNLVPGLDRMSQGIDITRFDLYSKDNDDQKHNVIQYTCNERKKTTIAGIAYDIPDQVDSVTGIPGGILNSKVTLVKTYNESREAVGENLEVAGVFKIFGFAHSQSLKTMQSSIFNRSRYVESVSAFDSARRARLLPDYDLSLHSRPSDFIERNLSADFDPDDPTKVNPYKKFIRYYGTHFFQTANYGGLLLVHLETKHDYYLKHSDEKVKKEASAFFLNILRGSGVGETENADVDEVFESMTEKKIVYFGGSANLLEPNGHKKWQPTVSTYPWLFRGNLEPIYKLIRNSQKKAAMERVVTDYVLRTYLDELATFVSVRQRLWKHGSSKLAQLQRKVNEFKAKTLISVPEMEALKKEILDEVNVPKWFSDKERNCYDWYPNSQGQCDGPTPHLCVAPGLMLKKERDATDAGGCHAWGSPARHDAWFTGLQLCFRWEECAGGWRKEFCKSIGEITTSYQHSQDARESQCQASWKVVIPDEAPVWRQNFRLCFLWRPAQEGGRCGGELCAEGNWTRYDQERMKLLQKCSASTGDGTKTTKSAASNAKNALLAAIIGLPFLCLFAERRFL